VASGWYTLLNEEARSPIYGNAENIQKELTNAAFRVHYSIVYPDLATLRKLYSSYINTALNEKNETVIILPFFETTDNVRRILEQSEFDIDVTKHERQGSLIIIDSLKGYFGSPGVMSLINQGLEHARTLEKNGLTALGDMESFFHTHKEDNSLIEHELSLPSEFDQVTYKVHK
jgi:hypothetical protein